MDCVNHPGVDAPYSCYRCHSPICVDCESKLDGASICPSCLALFRTQVAARYEAEQRNVGYCGAFFAGAVATSVLAAIWSQLVVWTGYPLEFFAGLLGGGVGYAVHVGAGNKRGRALQQLAASLALLGVMLGHYLIFYRTQFSGRLAVASGSPIVAFPAYLSASLDFLDWIFLIVGIAWGYWIPHIRVLREDLS